MSLPYQFWRSLQNSRVLPIELELEVSLNIADGIPLKWSANGKLTPITAQADRPVFVLNGAAQTSAVGTLVNLGGNPPVPNQIGNGYNATTGPGGNQSVLNLGGFAQVLPALNGTGIWRTTFTPVIKNFIANASGSPTSIILPNSPNSYAAGAFVGGNIYCSSLNQQVRITASSVVTAGNPITFTIAAPLGQPGATINADGLVFSATPLGPSLSAIKFSSVVSVIADGYVPSQLGVGSADYSGGNITIHDCDLQNGYVFVVFN